MKLKTLLEMPYHFGAPVTKKKFKRSYLSLTSAKRIYDELVTVTIRGKDVTCFILKERPTVILGCIRSIKPTTKEECYETIFHLYLKKKTTLVKIPDEIKKKNVLQVDYVETDSDFEGSGLASIVYYKLADLDYVVVSDTSQFDGGEKLWKKLSKEAGFQNCQVHIMDDEYGIKKDKKGVPISYSGSNLPHGEIWTYDADLSGEHILLLLIKKSS